MAEPAAGAREQARRLVVSLLATASAAAGRPHPDRDGTPCGCPLCRAAALVREPDPEFAAGLADGAGDIAAGVAQVLGAFGRAWSGTGARAGTAEGSGRWG